MVDGAVHLNASRTPGAGGEARSHEERTVDLFGHPPCQLLRVTNAGDHLEDTADHVADEDLDGGEAVSGVLRTRIAHWTGVLLGTPRRFASPC